MIHVKAVVLENFAKRAAQGIHYAKKRMLPQFPAIDGHSGVGTLADGKLVVFVGYVYCALTGGFDDFVLRNCRRRTEKSHPIMSRGNTMKRSTVAGIILTASIITVAFAQSGYSAAQMSSEAQDWYHQREARYSGTQWRPQLFMQVRTDLEHIGSAQGASEKENNRLANTKEELTKMQADLDQNRYDNGILNDVIDSMKKSANDERLSPRDRAVISDDLARLHEYQNNPSQWKH
jgi:hypothetical protein